MKQFLLKASLWMGLGLALFPNVSFAAEEAVNSHGGDFPLLFLFLIIMLLFARIGALAERMHQPAVLGELVMGIVLGALAFIPWFHQIELFKTNEFIKDIAEIGVILLLFRAGLESNIGEMKKVGLRATSVALLGVAAPFLGGWWVSKLLLPELDNTTHLFIGATLTATSVGITARVFKDLNFMKALESKIVLGAAVIDDVLGLLILAVVSGIVSGGGLGLGAIGILSLKALGFLVGAIVLGQLLTPFIGKALSTIHTGVGMKIAMALLFCAVFAYGASALAGLAPIIGAFAAGLVLDPVHFRAFSAPHIVHKVRQWADANEDVTVREEMHLLATHEEHAHVENLIDGISHFFVPIFFVYTGMQVNLSAFTDAKTLMLALAITVVAIFGKMVAGWVAGKGVDSKIIGIGMVPRGEVGLIFANIGRELGVVNDQVFAMMLIVVVLTTLVTPPLLSVMIGKKHKLATA